MIPPQAVEAALDAIQRLPAVEDRSRKQVAQAILEAAAPFIRAGALEDAADEMGERVSAIEQMVVEEWMYDALCAQREQAIQDLAWLRARAVAERDNKTT